MLNSRQSFIMEHCEDAFMGSNLAERGSYDVVIVGTGGAGVSSALSAVQTNPDLDIAMIERAPKGDHGGNTRYTEAFMRLQTDGRPVDNFVKDGMAFSNGKADRDLLEKLANNAKETIEWLEDAGVEFVGVPPEDSLFPSTTHERLKPKGRGINIIKPVLEEVTGEGVEVHYETTAEELIRSDDGDITGLYVRDSNGEPAKVEAETVIIACGGFEGNPEMMTQYVEGDGLIDLDTIAPGGQYNKGEGIRMAVDVGAATAGQFSRIHDEPGDPRDDSPDANLLAYPYGILVNKSGERFIDEGFDNGDETFEEVGREIRMQEDEIAYLVGDQKLFDVPNIENTINTEKDPYELDGDSVQEALSKLDEYVDIDTEQLVGAVTEYNLNVSDGDFDPSVKDGKSADVSPPKSNWAQKLDSLPLIVYPICSKNVFTFGGIAIDTNGQVKSADGGTIPGLYAAGEVTGFYYHKYLGATSVLRGLVYGREAGKHAANVAANEQTQVH